MSKYLRGALPIEVPDAEFEIRKKGDVWAFVDETISAVGSELYPWNPEVVKAIREFEPDFCPLWVTSVYRSPAGSYKVFGRHAIGIDCKSHMQEGSHAPVKVWTATYGVNAGRRPILVESLLQDQDVKVVPELSVFGYAPLDWGFYYKAKEGWYQTRKAKLEARADAEKEAAEYIAASQEATAKAKKALDDEADYRFDHETNRGQKIKDAFRGMTAADWRAMGVR